MSGMPSIVWVPAPCPTCGAQTEDEAGNKCRPSSDETGERYCEGEFDESGASVQPSPESLKAIDDWCDARERADG